jgi:hypothetical protein
MIAQRAVHGDASAKQRSRGFAIQCVWQRQGEAPVHPNPVGEASIPADTGWLRLRAKLLFAASAPFTDAATIGLPTDADALSDLAIPALAAHGGDGPDDLVSWDERIF